MKKFLILIPIIILISILIYRQVTYTHIYVMFKELRPIEETLPVYYKGLKIGKAVEKKHSNDYQHAILKIVLYPKNLHLPINTEVHLKQIVKNKKSKDFLELIYPQTPSDKLISNNYYLKGNSTEDIESYYKSLPKDDLETIKNNLVQSSANLNYALESLGQLFSILSEMVNENRPNLKNTTHNIEQSTAKISSTLNDAPFDEIFSDIQNTTSTTSAIIPNLASTSENLDCTMQNMCAITCGIKQTLSKRFGGLRLFFGKSLGVNERG